MTVSALNAATSAYGARTSTPATRLAAAAGANGLDPAVDAKLKKNATDFEAMFLETLVDRMYGSLGDEGPLGGGGTGGEVWRSMLGQQHARSIVKAGGIGVAASVYDELVKLQARSSSAAATAKAGS